MQTMTEESRKPLEDLTDEQQRYLNAFVDGEAKTSGKAMRVAKIRTSKVSQWRRDDADFAMIEKEIFDAYVKDELREHIHEMGTKGAPETLTHAGRIIKDAPDGDPVVVRRHIPKYTELAARQVNLFEDEEDGVDHEEPREIRIILVDPKNRDE